MERTSYRAYCCSLGLVLAALTACDNAPNPNFEQEMKDQRAARVGDPYAALSEQKSPARYLRVEKPLREAYASQEALSLRASYDSLLQKLDADPTVARSDELVTNCRASFADAAAFQKSESVPPEVASTTARQLIDRLAECRKTALAVQDQGNEATKDTAALLRRFASTGMVLVGMSTIGRGDEAVGLELWRQGAELQAQDRPGFKVRPEMFQNR